MGFPSTRKWGSGPVTCTRQSIFHWETWGDIPHPSNVSLFDWPEILAFPHLVARINPVKQGQSDLPSLPCPSTFSDLRDAMNVTLP
jgi:hypothetical protein